MSSIIHIFLFKKCYIYIIYTSWMRIHQVYQFAAGITDAGLFIWLCLDAQWVRPTQYEWSYTQPNMSDHILNPILDSTQPNPINYATLWACFKCYPTTSQHVDQAICIFCLPIVSCFNKIIIIIINTQLNPTQPNTQLNPILNPTQYSTQQNPIYN